MRATRFKNLITLLVAGAFVLQLGCNSGTAADEAAKPASQPAAGEAAKSEEKKAEGTGLQAIITTTKGAIELNLFADKAPLTVANFINLSVRGYYDNVVFHRVIADFMIQGGDPTGTGRGGPGYKFKDECVPELKFDRPGLLAMANAGPGTNGSQFFITHVPTPHLNMKHTIFGEVTKGQDVVNAVQRGDKIQNIEIKGDYTALFDGNKAQLDEWNKILDANKK
ncbi:MAG: peptidylprolyl isomerase [Candidatus Omnitrophica bacterium]|nr:putative peptidyl-prolyl cis-trans isomerase [bacterium]NUN98133.1 peptidylprolyl isomerase [Candidatus Omnitrophota bacterium]